MLADKPVPTRSATDAEVTWNGMYCPEMTVPWWRRGWSPADLVSRLCHSSRRSRAGRTLVVRCAAGEMRNYLCAFGPLFLNCCTTDGCKAGRTFPGMGENMASTRRRKLKKLRMKKANHGKRPLAGK